MSPVLRSALPTLLVLVGAALASAPAARPAASPPRDGLPERPNILLILSDDQSWSGLSVPMHPTERGASDDRQRTPRIAELAAAGMRFSEGYSPAPVCSPSRASIQTGKSPARLRWTKAARSMTADDGYRLIPPVSTRSLPQAEVTVGEVLKKAGYTTAHFGKWHLSGGGPGDHGYDAHDGDTSNGDAAPFVDPNPVDIFGMVERTEAFMEKAKADGRPFFAQLSFHALHYPQNARASSLERVKARGGWRSHKDLQRAALAEDLDEGVGRLMAALDRLELDDSTVVIYTSDNGAGGSRNGLLDGGKGGLGEGGIRVPFIVRAPGVKANSWCHEPVVGFDFLPTFADLAGKREGLPRDLEGTSFVPLLTDPGSRLSRPGPGLVFHFPHYQGSAGPQSTLRDGDLKVTLFHETGEVTLHDLGADPGEQRDLSGQRPEEAARLKLALQAHLKELGAEFGRPNPNHDPAVEPTNRKERKGAGEDARERRGRTGRGPGRRGDRGADRGEENDPGREGGRGGGKQRRQGGGAAAPSGPAPGSRAPSGWVGGGPVEAEVPAQARPFLAFDGLDVTWDEDFIHVRGNGLPEHRMMVGIRAWNQQVPLPQAFTGSNGFRIPRRPKLLESPAPTTLEGPIALAVNGIPIFDPTTQGGKHDAFEHGELDEFGGHAGRADDYHYHVAPLHLAETVGPDQPIAFGLDGVPIYGEREADGSAPGALDGAHGHRHADGSYHYHGTREKPYFMGGFAGEVDLDARPRTRGVRPFTRPLRGATITGFEGSLEDGYRLTYELRGAEHRIDYRVGEDGEVTFRFVNPDGSATEEVYGAAARGGGGREGGARRNAERDDADRKRPRGERRERADRPDRGERGSRRPEGGGSKGGASAEEDRQPWLLAHAAEIDADGDGQLTRDELMEELATACTAFDVNGDGVLTDDELDGRRVRSSVAGFLRGHRDELDVDGDGEATAGEVRRLFGGFFERQDRDGDGRIPVPTGAPAEGSAPRAAPPAPRPGAAEGAGPSKGLVVVLIDDMGWNDVGFMGNRELRTPHLDRLAAEGAVFDAAYASAPNCAPARACLLSGLWPGRHGVYTVVDGRNAPGQPYHPLLAATSEPELAPGFQTFAEELGGAGFATGFFGMWNLGKREAGPEGQGFDVAVVPKDLGFERNAYRDGSRLLPDELTGAALTFIEEHAGEPFVCYLALHSVHAPFDPDPELLASFEGKGGDPEFAATVAAVDRNMGRLRARLEGLGIDRRTTVLFTSDNGGERRRVAPLRGGKGELFEGGTRVPMVVWGSGVPAALRSDVPVSGVDVFPTLLDLAGLPPRGGLDGVSLAPILRGESVAQERALFWHFPCYTGQGTPASAMRRGRWKLVQSFDGEPAELFDLTRDPSERTDLAGDRPEVAEALLDELEAWQRSTGAALPGGPNPAFDPSASRGRGRGPDKGKEGSRERRGSGRGGQRRQDR
jgi:arylsulfatase A